MSIIATAVSATEELAPLLFPPIVFSLIAVVLFIVLGFVTWSFRDVANRHSNKTSKSSNSSHGTGH